MNLHFRLVFILLFASSVRSETIIPSAPQIGATAYILVDAVSGEVLVDHNADQKIPPASLTKIMTGYILADAIKSGQVSREDNVPISKNAWAQNPLFNGSSLMWIEPGLDATLGELENGIVISSGNDASVAVAEFLAGTEEAFSVTMNAYAKSLKLESTNFVNSHGLPDPRHKTSARDLAVLSSALIRSFPEHYSLYKRRDFTYNNIRQFNRNTLLADDPSVDGLKTGYTREAGYCLVASAERDDMRLVSVVVGTSSPGARKRGSRQLLNYGFRFFETSSHFLEIPEIIRPRIWQGDADFFSAGVSHPIHLTVPRGASKDIQVRAMADGNIIAPLEIGDRVGSVELILHDEVLKRLPLVAREKVTRLDFIPRLWDVGMMWLDSIFSVSNTD